MSKKRNNYGLVFLFVAWLIICIVLAIDTYAMDVSVVSGEKVGLDVSHDFGKAVMRVSPETSYSLNNDHTQVVSVTNTYGQDLYYWVDPYFKNNLAKVDIQRLDYERKETLATNNTYCYISNLTSKEVCEITNTPSQTYYEPVLSKLSTTPKDWGTDKHYITTNGVLVKAGSTQDFQIKYTTYDGKGKWNARIWANTINDYTCVYDINANCILDFTIDPSYDLSNLTDNMTSYYKMDEGTGSNVNDENTSNNNDLTLGAGSGWTTSGLIVNATTYTASTTSYARDTSASGVPTTLGWVNLWAYQTAEPTSSAHFMTLYYDGSNRLQYVINATRGINVVMLAGGTAKTVIACPSATHNTKINSWNMLTLYWDTGADSYELWVNGTNVSGCTRDTSGNPTGFTGMMFGNWWLLDSASAGFVGRLDEILVSKRYKFTTDELAGLYNAGVGCQYPFTCWDTANYTVTVVNQTYNASVFETQNYQYTINVSWGANVSNITDMTLNAFNYSYTPTVLSNGTLTNQTWRQYVVYDVRPPLVVTNGTIYPHNWTFISRLDNGTNYTNSTTNISQNVLWAYYPYTISLENQVIETHNATWNNTYIMQYGNMSDVSFAYTTQYDAYTNVNVTSTDLAQNSTITQNVTFYYQVPMLNSTDNVKSMTLRPYLNITFNGTTVGGRNTSLTGTQNVYKILLTNCSNVSITDATTNQFYVRDIVTDALLNANTQFNYTVWLTENLGSVGLSRDYSFNFSGNSSPRVCIYPNSTTFTYAPFTYTAYRSYIANLTGYLSSSANETVVLSNTSATTTIYLTNASAVQEVIITVTDQNDNELSNYSVNAYLYQNGSYNLLDTETTNLQGQVRFNLYIYDKQYQFRVYYPNSTLAKSAPSSGGMTIISTSFTIKIDLVPQVTIGNVIEMLGIQHNLTFNNATGLVNLTFNDTSNISCNNCLRIMQLTNGNLTLLGTNCTTDVNGSLFWSLGTQNGTFVAQYVAERCEDSLNYLIDSLVISRITVQDFEREGVFWSFLLVGTIAAIGLYVNPVLGIIFLMFGVIATFWIGILPIGWFSLASIIAGGLFVAFFLWREQ